MSDDWCVQKIDTKLESSYRNISFINMKTRGYKNNDKIMVHDLTFTVYLIGRVK